MTLTKLTRWSLCATVMAVGVGVAVGAAQTRTASADTTQGMSCSWKASGSAGTAVYHAAGAVDKNGKAYILGGLNQDGKVQQTAQAMDMSATNATTLAGSKSDALRNMPQKTWGAAAAYRPSNDPAKVGMIYVFGGAKDDIDYDALLGSSPPTSLVIDGEDRILEYDIDADSWRTVSGMGSMGNRLFPAASYSPEKNAILVTGGMKKCDFKIAVTDKKQCQADQLGGIWLTFDAAGVPTGVAPERSRPYVVELKDSSVRKKDEPAPPWTTMCLSAAEYAALWKARPFDMFGRFFHTAGVTLRSRPSTLRSAVLPDDVPPATMIILWSAS